MRRFIQMVVLLLLLATGGTAWYLYNKGFTKPWREWVVEELRKRGAEVSFSKLTLEPFRGLVAKDVKVYDSPTRKRVLAKVDEMVIEANYAHAARGEPFLDALTLVDASLSFPLDPKDPKGSALKIEKLNTRIHLPPKQLLVARLDAEVFGIRVSASGQLANPEMARSQEKVDPRAGPSPLLVSIVQKLRALQFEGRAPRLEVRFSGDLSKPESLVVETELTGEKIRCDNYLLESLAMAANWRNRALVIPRFEARDTVGQLQLSASYQSATGAIEARIRSGMDLPALFRATGSFDLGELTFNSVPQLDMTVRLAMPVVGVPPVVKAVGQIRVGQFRYGPVPMERLSADFAWDGPLKPDAHSRWAVRDLVVRDAHGGELRANAQQDFKEGGTGDFRLGLSSTLNPEIMGPYLRSRKSEEGRVAAARLALFKFHDAPKLTLSARGESPFEQMPNGDLKLGCNASGELTLGRTVYRNSEATSGHANLRFNGRVLNVDDFVVHRAEGIGGGELAFDLQERLVYIKNVRSALTPTDVSVWIDPELQRDIVPYRFGKTPPMLLINGVVDQRRPPLRTKLDIKMGAPAMDYTFCGKDLHFTNVDARLAFTFERLKLTDVRAQLFGGTVKGEGDISILKSKPGHTATLRFDDVDFQKLTKLYFNYDESLGKLDATYTFSGVANNGRVMRGEGDMNVTNGNVFAIPFLGPFSDILNKIVPGMGYNKAQKASTKFSIANGIITTKDFVVEGKGFSMIGDGRIWFLDDRMDFDMRVNAQGLPGVLLFPVSKLLEYRADSKFSEPVWRPKVIPKLGSER